MVNEAMILLNLARRNDVGQNTCNDLYRENTPLWLKEKDAALTNYNALLVLSDDDNQ